MNLLALEVVQQQRKIIVLNPMEYVENVEKKEIYIMVYVQNVDHAIKVK